MIRFNAFAMDSVGHQSPGLWTHPRDQSHRYTDIDYWVELAQLLEQGRFDGRAADRDKPWVATRVRAFQSPEVSAFVAKNHAGSLVPAYR